eukprot:103878-Chlamydomonas_euryale.AAC.2
MSSSWSALSDSTTRSLDSPAAPTSSVTCGHSRHAVEREGGVEAELVPHAGRLCTAERSCTAEEFVPPPTSPLTPT